MVTFCIYDYDNHSYLIENVEHNREDIKAISVTLLTGDEIVTLYWNDGSCTEYDEGDDMRLMDCYDGGYVIVTEEGINRWLDWEPPTNIAKYATIGYLRRDDFV